MALAMALSLSTPFQWWKVRPQCPVSHITVSQSVKQSEVRPKCSANSFSVSQTVNDLMVGVPSCILVTLRLFKHLIGKLKIITYRISKFDQVGGQDTMDIFTFLGLQVC